MTERTELQKVFELAFLALTPNRPAYLLRDALVLGADGDYFHEATRRLYGFFIAGLECGKVVARPGFKLVEAPLDDSDLI